MPPGFGVSAAAVALACPPAAEAAGLALPVLPAAPALPALFLLPPPQAKRKAADPVTPAPPTRNRRRLVRRGIVVDCRPSSFHIRVHPGATLTYGAAPADEAHHTTYARPKQADSIRCVQSCGGTDVRRARRRGPMRSITRSTRPRRLRQRACRVLPWQGE